MSRVRVKLAKVIEAAMLEQHGREVIVDPDKGFSIAKGYYRTGSGDFYRWTCFCRYAGMNVGPTIDSYDTMTDSARYGIVIDPDPRRTTSFEATARNKN